MKTEYMGSDQIFDRTMRCIAPLPCQADYVRQLASILSMHINRNLLMDDGYQADDLPSVSAIVVAPTGQGKTFILRKMAESLDLNLITVDCSTLSAEGWKGVGLAQRLLAAREKASSKEAFERSVLFFDEVDKLRYWGTSQDQGNPMVNILQMYNSGSVTAEGNKKAESIDVSRFTIFLGGAFEGLHSIIENRLCPRTKIGFEREDTQRKKSKAQLIQKVTMDDLANYGMLPELLGRIGTILTIPPLEFQDYRQLLGAESGSVRFKYNNYLKGLHGVSFDISDAGIDAIAEKCMSSESGARAVNPLINDLMRSAMAEVERDQTISKVILDADEGSCCIRYDHGIRGYFYRDPNRHDLPELVIRAKNIPALARKLCRYYRNAGGDSDLLPALQAFMECTLDYLVECAPPEDFWFESLEKLARLIMRVPRGSTFDSILRPRGSEAYWRFKTFYTPQLQQQLIMALQVIMDYIIEKNRPAVVKFALK